MNPLKLVGLTLVQIARKAFQLPQNLANAVEQRRLQILFHENEVERLDRIRNPDKYLGK
jgi:hypothetical protein